MSNFLDLSFTHSVSLHGVRVLYYIKEYCPIKDSSNMTINDWVEIALDIKDNYNDYDGFVVVHGTDTMAYSVSALSFMLENLGKSVVFTGSQVRFCYSTKTLLCRLFIIGLALQWRLIIVMLLSLCRCQFMSKGMMAEITFWVL